METHCVSALTRMTEAVNAGDAQGYASLYALDAVITIHGSGVLEGRGAIEQHEVELLREFPGARLAFHAVWQRDLSAVVHYAVNGRTPAGSSMGHEGLLFYRFDGSGLIAEEHRYMDSLTPMAQLGLLGARPTRLLPELPVRMIAHVAQGSADENDRVALVTEIFTVSNARGRSAWVARVSDDAVLDELVLPRPLLGKEAVMAAFDQWTQAVPESDCAVVTALGVGEFVLVETVVRGILRRPLGRFAPTGEPFAFHRAAIVHIRDGKLARVTGFMNGKELAQALRQWPPA